MSVLEKQITVIDFHKVNAASLLLPKPSILASSGWRDIHLELYKQPKFEIAEHQHTMHVIAYGLSSSPGEDCSPGERWLDGKLERERRRIRDIAIIPEDITHRCNWDTSAQYLILAIEPALLEQVGQDWVNADHIELIPQFMNEQDALIQGILSTLEGV